MYKTSFPGCSECAFESHHPDFIGIIGIRNLTARLLKGSLSREFESHPPD